MPTKTSTFSLKNGLYFFAATNEHLGTVYMSKRMDVTGDKHNELVLLEKDVSVTFCNC